MATYRLGVVCVLLCMANAVISVKIKGVIGGSDGFTRELELSENINGDTWYIPETLAVTRLVEGNSLPRLTVTNIKTVILAINNVSLENVPVFRNVSVSFMKIWGNKIKHVPTNAFEGSRTVGLDLINNQIQNMSVKSIYPDIKNLFLRCNELTEFSQDWFRNSSRLIYLDLAYNRIENIRDHAFNQIPHLKTLDLSNNYIKRIGSEAFPSNMLGLYLQFNSIEELKMEMFVDTTWYIWELYIHHNQLNYLSKELMLNLKIRYISLDGNPWHCKCLSDIERWIRKQNITRQYTAPGEPICVVPLNPQNVCVPAVDKESQQTYAAGLTPVEKCLAKLCKSCSFL